MTDMSHEMERGLSAEEQCNAIKMDESERVLAKAKARLLRAEYAVGSGLALAAMEIVELVFRTGRALAVSFDAMIFKPTRRIATTLVNLANRNDMVRSDPCLKETS